MGSIPGSFLAGKQTSKTAVQQICIDQNSGQIRDRKKEREENLAAQRRLSSAIELVGAKLKGGEGIGRKRADSENSKASVSLELAALQKRLAESERAKNEMEMQLRAVEREKRELEAEWARRNEMEIHPNSVGQILEGEIEEEQRRRKCQCGWIWEEKMAEYLRERDEIWAKRMAEEVEKRRKLIGAIEAKLGGNGLAELMETGAEGGKRKNENVHRIWEGKRPSTMGSNSNGPSENLERRKSDPRFENPSFSISTPPTRLSTASTLQSARINDGTPHSQQNAPLFRPSLNLRRQTVRGGSKGPGILDLEGICLDEKGDAILAEESEGEMEEELRGNIGPQGNGTSEQRRASTSAKSRDSGISY